MIADIEGGGTIYTRKHTYVFNILALAKAMELELRTGMKFSNKGSLLRAAQQNWGIKAKRKDAAIGELRALAQAIHDHDGEDYTLEVNNG